MTCAISKQCRTDEEIVKALRKDKVFGSGFSIFEEDGMFASPKPIELVVDCNGFFFLEFVTDRTQEFLTSFFGTDKAKISSSVKEIIDSQSDYLCQQKTKQAIFRTCVVPRWLVGECRHHVCYFCSSSTKQTNYPDSSDLDDAILFAVKKDVRDTYELYKNKLELPNQKLDPSLEAFPLPDLLGTSRNIFKNDTTKHYLKQLKEIKEYDFNN